MDRRVESSLDHFLVCLAFFILLHLRRDFLPQAIVFTSLIFLNVIKFKHKLALSSVIIIAFLTKLSYTDSGTSRTKLLISLSHPISSILITDFNSNNKTKDIEQYLSFMTMIN